MIGLAGRTCLVTGASGFLGSYVVERLIEEGARVRCLVRQTSSRAFLPTQWADFAIGDVTDLTSVRSAIAGVDVVFHLAGLIKTAHPEDYFRVNYLGTINLLEACLLEANRLQRVVLVSSQAAVGPSDPGKPLTESSPCRPIDPYGKSKLLAEGALRSYARRLPVTIVRPPTIYGPRDRETLTLFQVIALGLRPSLAGSSEISLIHAADLTEGILLAAASPAAAGQTYFITGDEIPSIDDLTSGIASALGRHARSITTPDWSLRVAARAAETARRVGGPSLVFDRWKAEELLARHWACSNALARAELGFAPSHFISDGLVDTARWYRKMGWL